MTEDLKLKAKKRDLAKDKSNHLRNVGNIPAVIHDHGKDSHHIVVDASELRKIYSEAGKHSTVELDVDSKKFIALIKEVTYKPATAKAYHAVFQAVKANEKVMAEVPIHISEDIPAEKASLLVVTGIDHVEIEALPKDLIDSLSVDASALVEAGDKITVADIKVPTGVIIKTDPEAVIAHVEIPKDQIAEADAAAAELAEGSDKPAPEESSDDEASSEESKPE